MVTSNMATRWSVSTSSPLSGAQSWLHDGAYDGRNLEFLNFNVSRVGVNLPTAVSIKAKIKTVAGVNPECLIDGFSKFWKGNEGGNWFVDLNDTGVAYPGPGTYEVEFILGQASTIFKVDGATLYASTEANFFSNIIQIQWALGQNAQMDDIEYSVLDGALL
jgi:hypothetical protein